MKYYPMFQGRRWLYAQFYLEKIIQCDPLKVLPFQVGRTLGFFKINVANHIRKESSPKNIKLFSIQLYNYFQNSWILSELTFLKIPHKFWYKQYYNFKYIYIAEYVVNLTDSDRTRKKNTINFCNIFSDTPDYLKF